MKVSVIIPAAGTSSRFGGDVKDLVPPPVNQKLLEKFPLYRVKKGP